MLEALQTNLPLHAIPIQSNQTKCRSHYTCLVRCNLTCNCGFLSALVLGCICDPLQEVLLEASVVQNLLTRMQQIGVIVEKNTQKLDNKSVPGTSRVLSQKFGTNLFLGSFKSWNLSRGQAGFCPKSLGQILWDIFWGI